MAKQKSTTRRRDNSSVESCGYITFILANVFFMLYFLWALLPNHIMKQIDEHYTTYYPPRVLAGYIPAYLVLLFVIAPVLYMGLNMLSCPSVDSIGGMWDTRSNLCCDTSLSAKSDGDHGLYYTGGECRKECNNDIFVNGEQSIESLPAICDEDIRAVNMRIRQNLQRNKS